MSVTVTVKGSPAEVAGLLRSLADGLPPAPKAAVAEQIASGGMVELFQVTGGHNATSLGKFTDAAHARTFAQEKSKLALHWKQGPVQGSYGATGQKDGAFTFYSVMPVEELWLFRRACGSGTAARTSATGRTRGARRSRSPLRCAWPRKNGRKTTMARGWSSGTPHNSKRRGGKWRPGSATGSPAAFPTTRGGTGRGWCPAHAQTVRLLPYRCKGREGVVTAGKRNATGAAMCPLCAAN